MVPDNWNFNGSNPCLHHGGNYNQNQNHGPFYVNYNRTSNSNDNIGCRILAKPQANPPFGSRGSSPFLYRTVDRTAIMEYGVLIGAFFSAWFLHLTLQPLDMMIHQKQYGVSHYLRQMDNFTIFGSNKRKLRRLLEDIKKWLAEIGMKIKGNWQIFRVGFTPKVERAHQALPKKKQRHRRPRLPSALGYRFGHGYTILRKHNLFRLKQSLHLYYYRRDRNRVISFKRASGLISRLGQLRKCNHQQVLDRHYQPKTMFALKKVVRKECRRLQALYPPYQAA